MKRKLRQRCRKKVGACKDRGGGALVKSRTLSCFASTSPKTNDRSMLACRRLFRWQWDASLCYDMSGETFESRSLCMISSSCC